jgi:hypothetical protein
MVEDKQWVGVSYMYLYANRPCDVSKTQRNLGICKPDWYGYAMTKLGKNNIAVIQFDNLRIVALHRIK